MGRTQLMTVRGPIWKVAISTTTEAEDAVTDLLFNTFEIPVSSYTDVETGAVTVATYLTKSALMDRKDLDRKGHSGNLKPRSQKRPSAAPLQGTARLRDGLKRIAACGLKIGSGKISCKKVRREDWAESWKRHFKPIEVGSALLIKPSWSKRPARKDQAVIVLDPGLSFGTGQHPTTSFCLTQLASYATRNTQHATRPSLSLLDIGTGSGILAIAAAKLGYQPVEAFDFDPEAVRIAQENARKNRVLRNIHITRKDVTKLPLRSAKQYDLICANLISTLLMAERPRILARLKATGMLVVAGILNNEFALVQRDYERSGLRLVASRIEKEWRSGAFTYRRQDS